MRITLPRFTATFFPALALLAAGIFSTSTLAEATDAPNSNYFYLVKGQLVGSRGFTLGDPSNWSMQVQGREGKSKSGKVAIAPASFKGDGDAIQITWSPRKKDKGTLGIYGPNIDLAAFKDKAALAVDLKVDVRPNQSVTLGMDCGYPCRAELQIKKMLNEFPKGEWFTLPIPLNCFKGEDFDLSKINGPFMIATEGKLTLSITNIRLEKLPEGEKGCTE